MKMGLRSGPVTSVRNYHYLLRSNPEERIFHQLPGGGLKSRNFSIPLEIASSYQSSTWGRDVMGEVSSVCMLASGTQVRGFKPG
jgi:hypothetical protein